MQTDDRDSRHAAGGDPLGDLIRAAGRRAAPPAEHYASVRAASLAAWQTKVALRRRRRRRYALAAAVLLPVVVAGALRLLSPAPAETIARPLRVRGEVAAFSARTGLWAPLALDASPLEAGDRIRTGPAAGVALELDADASLRIAAGSELTLTGQSAFTLAGGTVYLDTGDGADARTFAITTPHGIVRDVGTRFEVASSEATLRVRIRSGAVSLNGPMLAAAAAGTAGEELELAAGGALERRPFAPSDAAWQWVQALAVAPVSDDASIREYLNWISRETGRPLRYDSLATETRAELERFHGDPRGLMPLDLLESITATTDFEHMLEADGAILIRRSAAAP